MSGVVQLRRSNTGTPWGFRMLGGSEYRQPLHIAKVNPNSIAGRAGLQAGDVMLQIGCVPTQGMRHDQAKMEIIRCGNEVDIIIQRGGIQIEEQSAAEAPRSTVDTQSSWRGIPDQNPQVQSRSFKMLEQSLLPQ